MGNSESRKLNTQLFSSSRGGDVATIKQCINKGADVNCRIRGYTALHCAAASNQLPSVKCLVENGADVNKRSIKGSTALHLVATNENLEMVQYLVEHDADPNLESFGGGTVLLLAVAVNNMPMTKYLIEHGASKEVKYDGRSLIEIAKHEGYQAMADYLEGKRMVEFSDQKTSLNDTCPVCTEQIDSENIDTDTTVVLTCQHAAHGTCLSRWMAKKHTCPMCCASIA